MHYPGFFVAVNRAQFKEADRQVAVTAHFGFVDQDMARTVHRLQDEFFFVDLEGIHIFFVIIQVAGSLPKIRQHDMRSDHQLVTAL